MLAFEHLKLTIKRLVSDTHGGQLLRNLYLNHFFKKYANGQRSGNVLDGGCGIGSYTTVFGYQYPAFKFTGIDKNPENIQIAVKRANRAALKNVSFEVGDLLELNRGELFDLVYSVDVLEHIENYERVIENFSASLKGNGILIIHVPNSIQSRHLKEFESFRQHDHVREGFSREELSRAMENRGIDVLESLYTFGYWGKWAWEISMWALPKGKIVRALFTPLVFIFSCADIFKKNKSGNGVLVVGKKKIG